MSGIGKNSQIDENSFYDVNQKKYSSEELQLYRDLTGMPLYNSYEELMADLKEASDKKNTKVIIKKREGNKK